MEFNTTEFSVTALALGERRLLAAILRRAVLDYLGESQDLSNEAAAWIFHKEEQPEPRDYSFPWLCMQLEIDTASFLRKLLDTRSGRDESDFRATIESAFI